MRKPSLSRRDWLKSAGASGLVLASGLSRPHHARADEEANVIDIGSRRELFMNHKHLLGTAVALITLLAAAPFVLADKPNVVFILSDNQDYHEMSCHGHADIRTPHIDRFAKQSIDVPADCDGISLKPLLTGNADTFPKDRTMIIQCPRGRTAVKGKGVSIKTERWRLVDNRFLYDAQADPHQKNNIADKHPNVVAELVAEYEKYWASMPAPADSLGRCTPGDTQLCKAGGEPALKRSWRVNEICILWGWRLGSRGRPAGCSAQSPRNQYIRVGRVAASTCIASRRRAPESLRAFEIQTARTTRRCVG